MSDFKPCPFCGGEPCKSKQRFNVSWVYCSSCGASSGYRYDKAEAIEAWNTRAEQPEITRCRDCEYIIRHETANSGVYFACGYFDAVLAEIEPDGFCAWGERR